MLPILWAPLICQPLPRSLGWALPGSQHSKGTRVTSLKIRAPRGSGRPKSLREKPQTGMRERGLGDKLFSLKATLKVSLSMERIRQLGAKTVSQCYIDTFPPWAPSYTHNHSITHTTHTGTSQPTRDNNGTGMTRLGTEAHCCCPS